MWIYEAIIQGFKKSIRLEWIALIMPFCLEIVNEKVSRNKFCALRRFDKEKIFILGGVFINNVIKKLYFLSLSFFICQK